MTCLPIIFSEEKMKNSVDMAPFSVRLKELRTEMRWTQGELALLINTTSDSIYSWEKGRSEPSIAMICALCSIFEVSADYLLGMDTKKFR